MPTEKSPKIVTIYGRLSFPNFSYQQAVTRNLKSKFPKDPADVTPDFNLLVEQPQLDKLVTHLRDVYFPFVVQRKTAGEEKDALTQAEVDRIFKIIDSGDFDAQPREPVRVALFHRHPHAAFPCCRCRARCCASP